VENLKVGLQNGKQIIFTDEKSQHGKLKRIILSQLGIEESQVGILNATTVAEAGKKGKKPKKVKMPKELPDDPTEEQISAYYAQKAQYDDYIAAMSEVSLGGLEQIAADYNEGRTQILICNKKAEVGINLHKGTTDIHHLTLPWTPASIDQRNGRGARVGSSHDRVNVHYYCGKGSFDEFRLKTLQRKKNWIREILTSDKAQMDNADAGNMVEMQLLLAANPEERERKIAEQVAKAKAAALARAKTRANQDLQNYLKAQHAGAADLDTERGKVFDLERVAEDAAAGLNKIRNELASLQEKQAKAQATLKEMPDLWSAQYDAKRAASEIREKRIELNDASKRDVNARSALLKQKRIVTRLSKAESEIKRLRPVVKKALDDGLLSVDPDVIDHGKDFLLVGDKTYRVGQIYNYSVNRVSSNNKISYSRIAALNFDTQTAEMWGVFTAGGSDSAGKAKDVPVSDLGAETDVTPAELDLLKQMQGGMYLSNAVKLLSKDQFHRYLKSGQLILKDGGTVVLKNGEYAAETLNERGYNMNSGTYRDVRWYRENGENLVYPDSQDEQLKQAMAIACRKPSNPFSYRCKNFLVCLFGEDYITVMAGIGETAGADVIASFLAKRFESRSLWQSAIHYRSAVRGFVNDGTVDERNLTPVSLNVNDIPPQYINQADFMAGVSVEKSRRLEQARQELIVGKGELAQNRYVDFNGYVEKGQVLNEDSFLEVLSGRGTLTNTYAGYAGYQCAEACAAIVIIGLAQASEITPELLVNPANVRELAEKADDALIKMGEEGRAQLKKAYQIKRGLVTPEQAAAEQKKAEEAEAEKAEQTEAVDALETETGIQVRISTMAVRSKRGINFAAGGCFGLQDPKGKEGALYRAKDELKEKFGAKFFNGWRDDSEFPGSWWLISTRYDQEEVLKIVAKH
ncbi:hypothetical protein CYR55_22460, partial [Chimaeribacter californicus]